MKYLVTIEIDDPENAMGDSPDPRDLRAWGRYLDIEGESDIMRVIRVEVVAP